MNTYVEGQRKNVIDLKFKPISIDDKEKYERYLFADSSRGCELSFSNLISWGRHEIAFLDDFCVLHSRYSRFAFYPYPVGSGNALDLIDSIILDAKKRDIVPIIGSIPSDRIDNFLSKYGDSVLVESKLGSFDYVYDIDDLSTLGGKKYHKKRTHLNNFKKLYPDYTVETVTDENLNKVINMAEKWYEEKKKNAPENDMTYEHSALTKALDNFKKLNLDGVMIVNNGEVLAFSLGSRLHTDTLDVQFEKSIPEAYSAINYEFARYVKNKYPDILYLDREEDMGVEGLRQAKKSYYPHHMTEKFRARFTEAENGI